MLIIREMQIKTNNEVSPQLVRMALVKSLQIINARNGVAETEPVYTVGGNGNWCSHSREQDGGPLKS